MLPEQPISYPEFVADQLLTASNLNNLFNYLDEQERGTRINLIGIGIVCGLELTVDLAGTSIVISKGCGITSEGYLIRWDETKFENYKNYDPLKELAYSPFVSSGQKRFPIDELKSNSSEEGLTKLSPDYLKGKVVLLFVELLEVNSKNCDPESCDDKGKNITLTIRPLIVDRKAAAYLSGGMAGGTPFITTWANLPEVKMPRHHLPADNVFDSGDVFNGFQKAINPAFIKGLQEELTQAYSRIAPLVNDLYPSNPFNGIVEDYAFINNGTMTVLQLIYMQYYYDHFSDLIAAYNEMRIVGMELISLCCPNESLFPRHLLLGLTGNTAGRAKNNYRHYFIPSPAVSCHRELVGQLRFLFKRLVLMLDNFNPQNSKFLERLTNDITQINKAQKGVNTLPIRITPSKLDDLPFSKKSIPYYYNVGIGLDPLYQNWNFERANLGTANKQLSYHGLEYAAGDDAIINPLHYDLEPYNFLRIEGHIGHGYVEALSTINNLRDNNRLPFDVVALSADIISLREQLSGIANSVSYTGLKDGNTSEISMQCHFQDLEALYDTLAQGMLCNLCQETKYYYNIPLNLNDQIFEKHTPILPLLRKCDSNFQYTDNTIGAAFEKFYAENGGKNYIEVDQFLASLNAGYSAQKLLKTQGDNTIMLGFALLYYIEKLSEILPTNLMSFNIGTFQHRYGDLMLVAQKVKEFHQAASIAAAKSNNNLGLAFSEDVIDHLDSLLQACRNAQFTALYNDYKTRWAYLAMLQKFGYYVKMHPGIQHKAGVTMGGTFIIVYHEQSKIRKPNTRIFTKEAVRTEMVDNAATSPINLASAIKMDSNPNLVDASKAAPANGDTISTTAASQTESINIAKDTINLNANAGYASSGLHQLNINKLKNQLSQKQFAIIDRLFYKPLITKHTLDELTAQLPNKIVIADFYLPYMLGSDCPPVYFIVNEEAQPDPVNPSISLKTTQYCGDDNNEYAIDVSPTGGSVSGEGTQSANGNFIFNPSTVALGDSLNKVIQISYTKDGQTANINVSVFAKPIASFDVITGASYNLFIFDNTSQNASTITWDFGDGITGTGDNPSHNYSQDGVYVITLKATNGSCFDAITQTINVTKASISLDKTEFCNEDTAAIPINITPIGGEVKGDGINKVGDSFVFSPKHIAFDSKTAAKNITISYSLPGQMVQTTVKVYQSPSANFTVKDSIGTTGTIKQFNSSNDFPAQYSWEFGDGNTSVEANPVHQFIAPGSYLVKLTVTNGVCKTISTQTVTIIPTSVTISPLSFCSADNTNYAIATSPAGGSISGEGTALVNSGFVFNPNSIKFPNTASQKVVTISYQSGGQTASILVSISQTPNATFTVNQATAADSRTFQSNNSFPATYSWDFGDGTTSTDPNPTHQFKKPGDYKVVLIVKNGDCSNQSSQAVSIILENPITKNCGTIDNLLKAFKEIRAVNPDLFIAFTQGFKPYPDISKLFGDMGNLTSQAVNKQIDFFTSSQIDKLLMDWLKQLTPLVTNSDFRDLAITMWGVLNQLAMYIMCIQDKDFGGNPINLEGLFKFLQEIETTWKGIIQKLNPAALNQLKLLLDERNTANANITKNGEASIKINYVSAIKSLINILTKLLA